MQQPCEKGLELNRDETEALRSLPNLIKPGPGSGHGDSAESGRYMCSELELQQQYEYIA